MTAPASVARRVSDALHRAFNAHLESDPESTRRYALESLDRAFLTASPTVATDLRAWHAALTADEHIALRVWCEGDDDAAVRMRSHGAVLGALPRSVFRRTSLQNGAGADVRDRWIGMDYCFIADQVEGESPSRWYTLFRYSNRMFEPKRRPDRDSEIRAIDVEQLSFRARYLLRHTLILMGVYEDALNSYPNLRGLHTRALDTLDEPVVLCDPPRHSWAYFRAKNIWL